MVARLVTLPDAAEDLAAAYDWYEHQRVGLGEEYLRRVDACIQRIRRDPQSCPIVHESYRRALVRRFPYVIFYEFEAGTVTIHGAFHSARDPAKWRSRLP